MISVNFILYRFSIFSIVSLPCAEDLMKIRRQKEVLHRNQLLGKPRIHEKIKVMQEARLQRIQVTLILVLMEIVGPPVQDREKERERERERLSFVSAWNSNWEDDQKIILRMKLCRKFCFGEECPYEDRRRAWLCVVDTLSVENGIAASHQVEADRQGSIPVPAAPMINGGGGVKTVYWKTRLCGKFEKGQCPFGDSCHFAHGQAELLQHFVGRVEGEAMNSGACKRSICNETNCTSNSRFFCS
ncbi:hypothetical protein Bca52824_002337 [Brassica carinata]|uniref:C3H1-type domain-containing protein n=1 Tax=Brassica carinata TaxID=52824 RepID=A0A8X7WKM1_BRACI|nr:hypothetical protein Bca52824_002337 [Brassica carinata]